MEAQPSYLQVSLFMGNRLRWTKWVPRWNSRKRERQVCFEAGSPERWSVITTKYHNFPPSSTLPTIFHARSFGTAEDLHFRDGLEKYLKPQGPKRQSSPADQIQKSQATQYKTLQSTMKEKIPITSQCPT